MYLFIELTQPYPLIPKHTYMHDGFARRTTKICSQGSSEFTSRLLRRGDGTPAPILNKVIFIWRLNLAAASTPAAVYSSSIMDMASWKLQQIKHRAQLLMHSLWDMTRLSCKVHVFLKVQLPAPCLGVIDLPRHKTLAAFDFLSCSTPALL